MATNSFSEKKLAYVKFSLLRNWGLILLLTLLVLSKQYLPRYIEQFNPQNILTGLSLFAILLFLLGRRALNGFKFGLEKKFGIINYSKRVKGLLILLYLVLAVIVALFYWSINRWEFVLGMVLLYGFVIPVFPLWGNDENIQKREEKE